MNFHEMYDWLKESGACHVHMDDLNLSPDSLLHWIHLRLDNTSRETRIPTQVTRQSLLQLTCFAKWVHGNTLHLLIGQTSLRQALANRPVRVIVTSADMVDDNLSVEISYILKLSNVVEEVSIMNQLPSLIV